MKSLATLLMFASLTIAASFQSAEASVIQLDDQSVGTESVDSWYKTYEFSGDSRLVELNVIVGIPKDCNSHQLMVDYDAKAQAYVVGAISTVVGCSRPASKTKFTRFSFNLEPARDGSLRLKVPKRFKVELTPIYLPIATFN